MQQVRESSVCSYTGSEVIVKVIKQLEADGCEHPGGADHYHSILLTLKTLM